MWVFNLCVCVVYLCGKACEFGCCCFFLLPFHLLVTTHPQPQTHSYMTTPLLHPPLHHGGLDKDRSNVFVKYLPPEIDNDGLLAMFGVFGKIVSAKVMVDQETGLSLGYGYVSFLSSLFLLSFVWCLSRR